MAFYHSPGPKEFPSNWFWNQVQCAQQHELKSPSSSNCTEYEKHNKLWLFSISRINVGHHCTLTNTVSMQFNKPNEMFTAQMEKTYRNQLKLLNFRNFLWNSFFCASDKRAQWVPGAKIFAKEHYCMHTVWLNDSPANNNHFNGADVFTLHGSRKNHAHFIVWKH